MSQKKFYEVKILFNYTDEKLGPKKIVSERKSTIIYDNKFMEVNMGRSNVILVLFSWFEVKLTLNPLWTNVMCTSHFICFALIHASRGGAPGIYLYFRCRAEHLIVYLDSSLLGDFRRHYFKRSWSYIFLVIGLYSSNRDNFNQTFSNSIIALSNFM